MLPGVLVDKEQFIMDNYKTMKMADIQCSKQETFHPKTLQNLTTFLACLDNIKMEIYWTLGEYCYFSIFKNLVFFYRSHKKFRGGKFSLVGILGSHDEVLVCLLWKLGGAVSEITSDITSEITSEIISEVIAEVISEVPLQRSRQR